MKPASLDSTSIQADGLRAVCDTPRPLPDLCHHAEYRKGGRLSVSDLRQRMERDKAEYKGSDREAYCRGIDNWFLKLQTKYGDSIPIDEASRMADEIEADVRTNEARGATK
jgi:hypothetical protein